MSGITIVAIVCFVIGTCFGVFVASLLAVSSRASREEEALIEKIEQINNDNTP